MTKLRIKYDRSDGLVAISGVGGPLASLSSAVKGRNDQTVEEISLEPLLENTPATSLFMPAPSPLKPENRNFML